MLSLVKLHKIKILIIGSMLFFLLSYNLAFKKTVDEVKQYRDLKAKFAEKNNLTTSPHFLLQKLNTLDSTLNKYRVDSAELSNNFWLQVSGIATKKNLSVIYNPEKEALADGSKVIRQVISFEGKYLNMIKLIDSLEHTKNLGYLSSLDFKIAEKNEKPTLLLTATLIAPAK